MKECGHPDKSDFLPRRAVGVLISAISCHETTQPSAHTTPNGAFPAPPIPHNPTMQPMENYLSKKKIH